MVHPEAVADTVLACHRPNTTFCWFPPESRSSVSPVPPHRMPSVSMTCRAAACSRCPWTKPKRNQRRRCGRATVPAISAPGVECGRKDERQRSSPAMNTPPAMASAGPLGRHGIPSRSTRPSTNLDRPNRAPNNRLLPEPSAPVTATISPA